MKLKYQILADKILSSEVIDIEEMLEKLAEHFENDSTAHDIIDIVDGILKEIQE